MIAQCVFSHLGVFLISVKPLTTENTENKTTQKICKLQIEATLTREKVLEFARDNHMGKQTIVRVLEDLTQDQTLVFSGLKKASVSDLCSLLHKKKKKKLPYDEE